MQQVAYMGMFQFADVFLFHIDTEAAVMNWNYFLWDRGMVQEWSFLRYMEFSLKMKRVIYSFSYPITFYSFIRFIGDLMKLWNKQPNVCHLLKQGLSVILMLVYHQSFQKLIPLQVICIHGVSEFNHINDHRYGVINWGNGTI